MAIPGSDQQLLRGLTHIVRPKLNIFPSQVIATAKVNETPAQYPIGSLAVNNTANWDKVRAGQLYRITEEDGSIVSYGVVRQDPTSNTLYIDGKARGDAGYARRLLRAIASGQNIDIYSYQPLWSLLSRIYQGKFYKKYDIPYTNEGLYPNPVCNIGSWRQGDADASGYSTFAFDNDSSFAWFDAGIFAYQWTIPEEAIITSGGLTQDTITIKLPPGFYTIYCTITDTRNKSQTAMRPIWVNHPTLYPAASELYGMKISSDGQDRQGRSMNFRIYGDIPDELFIPGGAILFTENNIFTGGNTLSQGVEIRNYAGLMSQEMPRYELINGQKSVEFETKSPYRRMADIPMVNQAIFEKSLPKDWNEIGIGYGDINFITWYILKHHSTFLETFDYYPLEESPLPRKKNWELNGSTISEYLDQSGKLIGGNIGSLSDGSLIIRRDPNIEEHSFRDALDLRYEWTENDITDPIEITRTILPNVGQLRAFAFAYDPAGTEPVAVAAIAPGFVQSQGPSKQDEESILLSDASTAQDKINRVAGHMYAKANNAEPEIQIKANRNIDITDPAQMVWHRINLPPAFSSQANSIYMRVVPKNVDRAWENNEGSWLKSITITFDTESFGQPGETYIVNAGGGSIYPPEDPGSDGEDYWDPFDDFDGDNNGSPGNENDPYNWVVDFRKFKFLLAIDDAGNLGITFNGFEWYNLRANIPDDYYVCDAAINWNSNFIKRGFVSGKLGCWVTALNQDATTIKVYYNPNILSLLTIDTTTKWEEKYSFSGTFDTPNNKGVSNSVRILTYPKDYQHITVVWWDMMGVQCRYSLDYGSTWSNAIRIQDNPAVLDYNNRDVPIGADIDPTDGTLVTSGITGTVGGEPAYQMMYLEKGATLATLVEGSPDGNIPYPAVDVAVLGGSGYSSVGHLTTRTNDYAQVDATTYQLGSTRNCIAIGIETGVTRVPINDEYIVTESDPDDLQTDACKNMEPGCQEIWKNTKRIGYIHYAYGYTPAESDLIQVDGWDPGSPKTLPAGNYSITFGMDMFLDGLWDINKIDMSYIIEAIYPNDSWGVHNYSIYNNYNPGVFNIRVRIRGVNGLVHDETYTVTHKNIWAVTNCYNNGVKFTYYCATGMIGGGVKSFVLDGLDYKNVYSVKIEVTTDYHSFYGQESSVFNLGGHAAWYIKAGIKSIRIDGTSIRIYDPAAFRFVNYKTPPATFYDITPDGVWAPFAQYGISPDPVITTELSMVGTNSSGSENFLFYSHDRGATWVPIDFVDYSGIHKVGPLAVLFGYNAMDISDNNVVNVSSAYGNWANLSGNNDNVFTQAISVATLSP